MSEWLPLVVGAATAAVVGPPVVRSLPTRKNYRGAELAFPAGVAAVVAGIVAAGILAAARENLDAAAAVLVLGVAFLGLLDDLLDAPPRGWRGHFGALRSGEVSTGVLKAVGTVAVAAVALTGHESWVVGVLVIALTTNLFNLLDLRPGRAWKAGLVACVVLAVAGRHEALQWLGPWLGPLLVLGFLDLREHAMLGDTGANALGALVGLWLVVALGPGAELVALAVLLGLNALGELVSFTRVIERVGPLRWLDELGRPQRAG